MPQGAKLAEELETAHYTSIRDVLSSSHKPDGAIVCTPNHTHISLAIELTNGGVQFCSRNQLRQISKVASYYCNTVKKNDLQILVGHHRRFNPYMVVVKEALESKTLGQIIAISGLWILFKPPEYYEAPTEWRKTKAGGAVLMNLTPERSPSVYVRLHHPYPCREDYLYTES